MTVQDLITHLENYELDEEVVIEFTEYVYSPVRKVSFGFTESLNMDGVNVVRIQSDDRKVILE